MHVPIQVCISDPAVCVRGVSLLSDICGQVGRYIGDWMHAVMSVCSLDPPVCVVGVSLFVRVGVRKEFIIEPETVYIPVCCTHQIAVLASERFVAGCPWQAAMAPHLTPAELDHIHALEQAGKTPIAIHAALATARRRKRMHAPCLVNVRRALEGKTHKRGLKETRGRKRLYSRKAVLKMDKVRKQLIKKAANDREVLRRDIRRASRVPPGDRTTLKKAFDREGIPVAARRPREKPQRSRKHKADRLKFAQAMAGKPPSYYESSLDMIIDNKKFDIPTTERARLHMESQRVRFHLRTPSEETVAEFTKPGRKKNRCNTGAQTNVCAGVCNGRIFAHARAAGDSERAIVWSRSWRFGAAFS